MSVSLSRPATPKCNICNISSVHAFLPMLARSVLDGTALGTEPPCSDELPGLTIYLPTVAAVQPLKLAFLAQTQNKATFLPRILVLGDTKPLEIFAAFAPNAIDPNKAIDLLKQAIFVPAAEPDLQHQLRLTFHISEAAKSLTKTTHIDEGREEKIFKALSVSQAFSMAERMMHLFDEAYRENIDLKRLSHVTSENDVGHEQLSLQLLKKTLAQIESDTRNSAISREKRRNRLMAIEAQLISNSRNPVIIAGSTGSVTATLSLMKAALSRDNHAIILNGLDSIIDQPSWQMLKDHPEHPQYGLHQLLLKLNVERNDIRDLTAISPQSTKTSRKRFLSEAMRPASSTDRWQTYLETTKQPFDKSIGLSLIEAENAQDEAEIISLILSDALRQPHQTAAFVTPDKRLIERVGQCLGRFGLPISRSHKKNNDADYARDVINCIAAYTPEALLTLLRHKPESPNDAKITRYADLIDLGAICQIWRPASLDGLDAALHRAAYSDAQHPVLNRIMSEMWKETRDFVEHIKNAFQTLHVERENSLPFGDWLSRHQTVLDTLQMLGFASHRNDSLDNLASLQTLHIPMTLKDYAALFTKMIQQHGQAISACLHPRLFLWHSLDARLMSADIVVLAGLNEGVWPQNAEADPWLTRKQRSALGFSPLEKRTGQSAQDFESLACSAEQVYLTRARLTNGTLARSSRWVSRIKVLAAGANISLKPEKPWQSYAKSLRNPDMRKPISKPEPRPPVLLRPRRLSVTSVETWFANPYAIYARYILKLDALRPSYEKASVRDRGTLFHAALHDYSKRIEAGYSGNGVDALKACLEKAAEEAGFDLSLAPFWQPRFERFSQWFVETEKTLRQDISLSQSEVSGRLTLAGGAIGPFEITSRADRIDLSSSAIRIYDYKTSANTARQSITRNAPQLALEGLLAQKESFAGFKPQADLRLAYIIASGGMPAGEILHVKGSTADAIANAYTGLVALIARFDQIETPYLYTARSIYKDRADMDPYAHLARVKEWRVETTASRSTNIESDMP